VTIRTSFGKHKLRNSIVLGAMIVVIAALAGPFVYIHFIEGPPPKKLSLPTSSPSDSTSGTSTGTVNGTWDVSKGSIVGYRVSETLLGQNSTAVGRTSNVWGSLEVNGTSVTSATFSVDMATVVSDQSERNAQFDGRIMDVTEYPTARFTLTSPIKLGSTPKEGVTTNTSATGDLTLHGVTQPITFKVSIERTASGLDALAEIPIKFSTWKIVNPSIAGFVTTSNSGTLEVLLSTTTGVGNSPSKAGAPSSSGGGTPITVPSTTVPGLKLPSQ
jgi:polyisoprenoid-binding protein YceI